MVDINEFDKDPDAVLDYSINWGENYLADGETITGSTWVVPSGIVKDSDSYGDTITTIWLSGGTAGSQYELENTVTTSDNRTDVRRIFVHIKST